MEEINHTANVSPRDYAMILPTLSDASLLEEAKKNQWLMDHIQMSDVDFKARYLACQLALFLRSKKTLDNPASV